VLEGTETGLLAMRHLFDHGNRRVAIPSGQRVTTPSNVTAGLAGEASALEVLAAYGIPVPRFDVVSGEADLTAAAGRLGYPVVLKTATPIAHKSEERGVLVGIEDEAGLAHAYRDLSARLGPEVTVAEHIEAGVEIALGMVTDPQFGPVVIVSAGGRLIEVMDDRVALLPPVEASAARRALDRLRIRPLLEGFRGGPPADLDRLVDVIVRFSELATDAAGQVNAIDVNPVIAGPDRAVAVDALMTSIDDPGA
jgi:succinyl-CoA synthetase beta subunit